MLSIKHPRTHGMKNPLGITLSQPKLTWYLESDQNNTIQTAFRLIVSDSIEEILLGKGSFFDSGKIATSDTFCLLGHPVFESRKRLYWAVRSWDDHGELSEWCEPQWFETGLMHRSDWKAQWIEPKRCPTVSGYGYLGDVLSTPANPQPVYEAEMQPCPILRKQFSIEKTVKKARIYATAHGIYQLSINGKRVGDLEFMPEATPYHKMLQVQTYDVTELLSSGENTVGAVLGDGWWAGRISFYANPSYYGDQLALLMQLEIEYNDGSKDTIATDTSFTSYFGEILYSDLGIGEKVDRRKYVPGWDMPGTPAGTWSAVSVKDFGYENLIGQNAAPIRIKEILKPVSVKEYPDGTLLYDFGQVISGNAKITFDGTDRCGEELLLSYCEQVDRNGDFIYNFSGYRRHEDVFILCGEAEEVYEPKFTYRGFRWLRIKGYSGKIKTIEARLIASDVDRIGDMSFSDERITQLQSNIRWTMINNLFSIPTDNPDRERAGWTGDFQMIASTMFKNYELTSFIERWMTEHRMEQHENGAIPMIIPMQMKLDMGYCAGWGDDCIIVPWEAYLAYGDKQILVDNYEMMQKWMDYVLYRCSGEPGELPAHPFMPSNMDMSVFKDYSKDMSPERRENFKYIWNNDYQYGDWLTPSGNIDENGDWVMLSRHNNETFFPCYFTVYCSDLMTKIADILGKESDKAYYADLHGKFKKASIAEFYDSGFIPNSEFQGVLILALHAGIYPEGQRKVLEDRLIDIIYRKNTCTINTGFASMEHLMPELVASGQTEAAYDLLLSEGIPSYIYMIKNGATAIWETWVNISKDGTVNTASYTQFAIGNVGKWLMEGIVGIAPAAPGYKQIRIAPVLDPRMRITSANGSLITPHGPVKASWNVSDEVFTLDISVPVNTTAEIFLPNTERIETVGSGSYRFQYKL